VLRSLGIRQILARSPEARGLSPGREGSRPSRRFSPVSPSSSTSSASTCG